MLSYKPSVLAAAAVYLAASITRDAPWTEQLRSCSGYTVEQLTPCARQISEHVNRNPITASRRPLHAVRKKFENHKFMAVAEENPPVLCAVIEDRSRGPSRRMLNQPEIEENLRNNARETSVA